MQMVQPVIDAVGEARSNMEVFSDLASRLAIEGMPGASDSDSEPGFEPETDAETLLRVLSRMPDDTRSQLLDGGIATPHMGQQPIQFVDIFPNTPDRKVHLYPEEVETLAPEGLYSYQVDPATDKYPLALISPASEKTISSMMGQLRTRTASLFMHPQDASARSLSHGDAVRVFNDLGEIHCLLHVGDAIAPGTVSMPKGLWRKSTMNRSTANALAPDTLTDLGGGACFNDARVEVVRILDASWEGQSVSLYVPTPTDQTDIVH
jgi:anaerobic selenocysteine-containing dehydrogenase